MKFLKSLIEEAASQYKFTVEIYNRNDEKVDEITVLAATSQEAEDQAVSRSGHPEAFSGLAVDKEDVE